MFITGTNQLIAMEKHFQLVTSMAWLADKPEIPLSSMPLVRVRCSFALIVMPSVLRKGAHCDASRELYSGSAMLRGLPAWQRLLQT